MSQSAVALAVVAVAAAWLVWRLLPSRLKTGRRPKGRCCGD
jgi:membrane protein implicated in regulation of membrane protease activity